MKFEDLEAAWDEAQQTPDFYDRFGKLTGIPKKDLMAHFNAWNQLSHEEILGISRKYGKVRPCFRAYLAKVTEV